MISIARFSVHILLLHHYKNALTHISDFDSLVIGTSKSERWAKNIKKTNDKYYRYIICTLLSSFGQKMYGPKILNIGPFRCTTNVEPDQNIFEWFWTNLKLWRIRLTDQLYVRIKLKASCRDHPYSTNYFTPNFNSLIFFDNYHWLFHLGWLFEIRTDPGFVQNLIWESARFGKQMGVDILSQAQRGSTTNRMNPSKNYFEENKHIFNLKLMC